MKISKWTFWLFLLAFVAANASLYLRAGEADEVGESSSVDSLLSAISRQSGLEIMLPAAGWTWNTQGIQGTPDSGKAAFSRQKWLMELIHWGPVQTDALTVTYVRNRMQTMWGVNFEFTGAEGKTQISGHPAVYVEAYGPNRAFFTRFVIWNCPESGREFIADMNYNLMLKTPAADFETELRVAKTTGCHPGAPRERFPDLTSHWESDKNLLTFDHPERWFFFDSPFYVPFVQYEGVRDRRIGSIMGLCSDQNMEITLMWGPAGKGGSAPAMLGADQGAGKELRASLASVKSLASVQEEGLETFQIGTRSLTRLWGGCEFQEPEQEMERKFFGSHGIFAAASWNVPEKNKKVTIVLLTREYRYQSHTSSPTRDAPDRFLRDFVAQCH